MPDWSGRDYADVSSLQRAMATEAVTALQFGAGDRVLDVGCGEAFIRWCSVVSTAWTGRLPAQDRAEFVADQVQAYEPIARREGLFRFTQMRSLLHR